MEKIRTALDTKDRVASHNREHDAFDHHVREAPLAGAMADLTDVAAEFTADRPSHDRLAAALDTKDRLAAHGMTVAEEEALWREELDEAVRAANA